VELSPAKGLVKIRRKRDEKRDEKNNKKQTNENAVCAVML